MVRKLSLVFLILLLAIGCSQQQAKQETSDITLAELTTNTGDYVGKIVQVKGTVNHVCRHGGKKLFIIGDSPNQSFKINAGVEVGSFNIALEGSDVQVLGVIEEERVDAEYLDEWEAQACPTEKNAALAKSSEQSDELTESQKSTLKNINSLREKLDESEKPHLSFYSMSCQSFKEIS